MVCNINDPVYLKQIKSSFDSLTEGITGTILTRTPRFRSGRKQQSQDLISVTLSTHVHMVTTKLNVKEVLYTTFCLKLYDKHTHIEETILKLILNIEKILKKQTNKK